MTRAQVAVASFILLLATAVTPARAQGKGNGNGHGTSGNGNGHNSSPPASSPLPSPTAAPVAPVAAETGSAPFGWIDDATVLPPGTMVVSASITRWQGSDLSEMEAPVVGVAAGFAPRLQLGASIPHIIGDDINGVAGGLGTTYISAKIAVLTGGSSSGIKLAVAPTLEVLGVDALQSLSPGTSRAQLGLPVSMEIGGPSLRVFTSAGYFTQGVWYAGGGVGGSVSRRIAVSAAFSRAWSANPIPPSLGDRVDASGTVAYALQPHVSVFGSVGTTIATADQDGAGTTITAGVVFLLTSARGQAPVRGPARH